MIDSFVIPNLHEAVFPAIAGIDKVEALEALGIVESFSVASLIEGADAAVKSGQRAADRDPAGDGARRQGVRHDDGNVAAVQSAVDAGAQVVAAKGIAGE